MAQFWGLDFSLCARWRFAFLRVVEYLYRAHKYGLIPYIFFKFSICLSFGGLYEVSTFTKENKFLAV